MKYEYFITVLWYIFLASKHDFSISFSDNFLLCLPTFVISYSLIITVVA